MCHDSCSDSDHPMDTFNPAQGGWLIMTDAEMVAFLNRPPVEPEPLVFEDAESA